ncbi:helix-turn-helix transcriptional regulator [Salinibacterium hongtaonis]|uniref:helix-turn-helix transcriptional regulator n=1 Tax=Homoserinimonas hongtaonis TaxID=2079791 RepID=UPI000D3689CA|nr:WYL domain-containing protein [Salinibacterium hongtaonis]AWB89149.1 WYL domain-containing protein [Salinibacterium hongtaonis]
MAENKRAPRARVPQAGDKLAFLLVLVPYLMEQGRISVAEVAAHFGVSESQVRDAVKLIAVSGIPGETGTYQHGDLFDLAWDDFSDNDEIVLTNLVAIDDAPRFSAREAAALIAGLQYLSALPENADIGLISALMAKLSRGASATPSPVAVEGSESSETLRVIRDAVTRGLQLEFDYIDWKGERASRRVDPLRVESLDADWYLRAWDHVRESTRTFRLDRIIDPVVSDQPVSPDTRDILLGDSLFEGSSDDIPVTLEVASAVLPLLADFSPSEPETVAPDVVRTTVVVPHYHRLKRLVAGMPGTVRVVAPADARAAVADWVRRAESRYDADSGQ